MFITKSEKLLQKMDKENMNKAKEGAKRMMDMKGMTPGTKMALGAGVAAMLYYLYNKKQEEDRKSH